MSDVMPDPADDRRGRRYRHLAAVLTGLAGLFIVVMVLLYFVLFPSRIGLAQPIPFSHRVHAGDKTIGCLLCPPGAADTPRADLPPLETCMLCHEHIIITYPPVADLREHYFQGRPVEWVRVNEVPDFVYFNHQMHVRRGIDCSHCHGDVKAMDRIEQVHPFKMGYCVQCHRENQASHDCLVCHR